MPDREGNDMGIRRREVAVVIAAFAATTVMATALSALHSCRMN